MKLRQRFERLAALLAPVKHVRRLVFARRSTDGVLLDAHDGKALDLPELRAQGMRTLIVHDSSAFNPDGTEAPNEHVEGSAGKKETEAAGA
jgi:hypothetical protein